MCILKQCKCSHGQAGRKMLRGELVQDGAAKRGALTRLQANEQRRGVRRVAPATELVTWSSSRVASADLGLMASLRGASFDESSFIDIPLTELPCG